MSALLITSVVFIVSAIFLTVGLRSKKASDSKSFFLADKGLSSNLFIFSFIGTFVSVAGIEGIPGFFYAHGIGTLIFVVLGVVIVGLSIIFYGIPLMKLAQQYDTYSPVDVAARRYNSNLLGLLVSIVTLVFVAPHFIVQLIGIGRFVSAFSENTIPLWSVVGFILLLTLIYSWRGGIRAIARTDRWQVIFMLTGLFVLAGLFLFQNWSGFGELFTQLSTERPELLTLPGPNGLFSITSLVSMILLLGLAAISQPRYSTRFLMTTDTKVFKRTAIAMIVLGLVVYIPTMILGLGGALLYPELASGDEVIGTVLANLQGFAIPVAILFFVAVLSAGISTIDSQLIALSSIFTKDIYSKYLRRTPPTAKQEFIASKIFIFIFVGITFLVSFYPPKLILDLALLALAGGAQLVPTYTGQFHKKPLRSAAFFSIIIGLVALVLFNWVLPAEIRFGVHPGIAGMIFAYAAYYLVHFGNLLVKNNRTTN